MTRLRSEGNASGTARSRRDAVRVTSGTRRGSPTFAKLMTGRDNGDDNRRTVGRASHGSRAKPCKEGHAAARPREKNDRRTKRLGSE